MHGLYSTYSILSEETVESMLPNTTNFYNLGMYLDLPELVVNGQEYVAYGHDGDIPGYQSRARYIPDLNITIVGTDNNFDSSEINSFYVNQTLEDVIKSCNTYFINKTSTDTTDTTTTTPDNDYTTTEEEVDDNGNNINNTCTAEQLCLLPTSYLLSTLSTSITSQCESMSGCFGGIITLARREECDDGSGESISVDTDGFLQTISVIHGKDDDFIGK